MIRRAERPPDLVRRGNASRWKPSTSGSARRRLSDGSAPERLTRHPANVVLLEYLDVCSECFDSSEFVL